MKKVSLVILFLLAYCISFSQFTITQNLGAPKTLVVSKGGLSADSALILPYYPDTTTANLSPYVKYYAGNMIRVGNVVYVRNSTATGWITIGSGSGGSSSGSSAFGSFYDSTTQTIASTTVAYPIKITKTDTAKGFHISNNKIIADSAGVYNIQWSGQFQNADNAENDVTVWIRKNGVNVVGSTGFISVPKTHGGGAGTPGHTIASWNYIIPMSVGDSIVFYWQAGNTLVTLQYYPQQTSPTRPSTASVIVTITPATGGGGGGGGTGSVTSISQGYGITNTPNPITSTGTIKVDTATLSVKYMLKTDTTNKFVNNITRTPGKDSIIFFIGANRYAIKDSAGGSGTTTTAVDTIYRTIGKDSIQFKINGRYYAIKDSSGGGGTVTRAVDTIYRTLGKDSIIFTINGTRRAIKDSVGIASASFPLYITNPTTNPTINIYKSSLSLDGYLSSTDFYSFASKVGSVSGSGLLTSSGGSFPTISTSVNANKLVGRNSVTGGEMEEITIGSGLSMTGTTLFLSGGTGGSQNLQQVINTGDTLTNTFHFSTNAGNPKVNLDGVRLSAPQTYQFPDSSGILALKSDLTSPMYSIDLTSGNYTMNNIGIYYIRFGTDSTTGYSITFPAAGSFAGKRITIVNADESGYNNNALIDTSTYENIEFKPKYQGTYKTIGQIPYGMTYEFISTNGVWMSTNPMPVYTDTFASDYYGAGTTFNIPFGGTYKLINVEAGKQDNYYIAQFPDPKKNNGERITLINEDATYSLKIEGTWIPVSKNTYGGQIVRIPPQSTYEFVSIDSQWICVNTGIPLTFFNIDLTTNSFNVPAPGAYQFLTTSGSNSAFLPNADWYDGKQIILINSDPTTSLIIGGTAVYPNGTSYTSLGTDNSVTLVSIGGKWFVIK